jgi:hypothetical protein
MSLADLWNFFHCGPVQNTAHKKAFCKGCVTYHLLQASLNTEISEGLDSAASLQTLLAILQYSDLLDNEDNEDESEPGCVMTNSRQGCHTKLVMQGLQRQTNIPTTTQ